MFGGGLIFSTGMLCVRQATAERPIKRSASTDVIVHLALERMPLDPPTGPRGNTTSDVDIARVQLQRGLEGHLQAVVNRVVELPEAHDARELDDLRRREERHEPIIDVARDVAWILGRGAHEIEAH